MLHIILLILKIIGILILSLVGLLLAILLVLLLVPIRYKVTAEHGEEFRLEGGANWLLHLLNVKFTHLEGVFHIRVRILCFLLFDNLKPRHPKNKVRKNRSIRKRKPQTHHKAKKDVADIKEQKQDRIKKGQERKEAEPENKHKNPASEIIGPKTKAAKETVKEEKPEDKSSDQDREDGSLNVPAQILESRKKEKKSVLERILIKIRGFKEKVLRFFRELRDKCKKLFETVVNIKHKIGFVSDFIKDELNREGFKITYSSLKKLLKHILPTKLKSKIIFGTGDPCSTGQLLGAMSILYSFYGGDIQITPDFENKRFEGRHYARGRIRLVTILIIVIKLMVNKRFKQLKRNFQVLKEAL